MKKLLLPLFFLAASQLFASTIIVNSIFDIDENPKASEQAGFVEDGLMNSLFDLGFIMFTTFNAREYRVDGAKDARYMISIEPHDSESSVSWKLNATVNGMLIDEGSIEFSTIEGYKGINTNKIYYLIGEEVAAKVSRFF